MIILNICGLGLIYEDMVKRKIHKDQSHKAFSSEDHDDLFIWIWTYSQILKITRKFKILLISVIAVTIITALGYFYLEGKGLSEYKLTQRQILFNPDGSIKAINEITLPKDWVHLSLTTQGQFVLAIYNGLNSIAFLIQSLSALLSIVAVTFSAIFGAWYWFNRGNNSRFKQFKLNKQDPSPYS